METAEGKREWWCSTTIRISHPELDPTEMSKLLSAIPQIAQRPGESRVPHGDCRSAGYWCVEHLVDAPNRPNVALSWVEDFCKLRESDLCQLLKRGYHIDIYVAVFSNILALGFDVPPTPTIWRLGIQLGLEFFSR